MKKAMNRKYIFWTTYTIIIIVLWGLMTWTSHLNFKETESSYFDLELSNFKGKIESILKTYESFSNYIFDDIKSDSYILSHIREAATASDEEKKILRQELYDYLIVKYEHMTKYKFRQLHFQLANTESFLRMHRLDTYGDLLYDIRDSIKIANETDSYVSGFEEGRIFNGYRFVYPLHDNNELIGTAEVSISTASILEILSDLYPAQNFKFIIKKSEVQDNVFEEEISNYTDSYISENYYFDREVTEIIDNTTYLKDFDSQSFFSKIKDQYEEQINNNENFVINCQYNGENYIVKFLTINNIVGQPVAYLITFLGTDEHADIVKGYIKQIIFFTVFTISIITFGWAISFYQSKIQNIAHIDFLTQIYNRHIF
ncbi:MAG: hypothetical protein JXR88_02745 [Clostridia bacterium]|nr:hypothetical protein [Clostridia bacterium]